MKFLDTNVLVYAADKTESVRHDRAMAVLLEAFSDGDFMISTQVLNEFSNVALSKLKKTDDEVKTYLAKWRMLKVADLDDRLVEKAIDIRSRYGLQFYDSLLLATAEANRCEEFWSEDLNDGQIYCGMKAVNPFKSTAR